MTRTTSMDPPRSVHIQCKETNIFNDTNKFKNQSTHPKFLTSDFWWLMKIHFITFLHCSGPSGGINCLTQIQVPRDSRAVLTSSLMYSALFIAPLTHCCNCDSVKGLPPGLWTEHSTSPWTTTVTTPLDKLSSSLVGSVKRISLKIEQKQLGLLNYFINQL